MSSALFDRIEPQLRVLEEKLEELEAQIADPQVAAKVCQACGVPVGDRHAHGLLLGIAHLGADAAEGGEDARLRRHHHPGHAEGPRHLDGVHGAGAAEGEQGALPAVDAPLHRDAAQCAPVGLGYDLRTADNC